MTNRLRTSLLANTVSAAAIVVVLSWVIINTHSTTTPTSLGMLLLAGGSALSNPEDVAKPASPNASASAGPKASPSPVGTKFFVITALGRDQLRERIDVYIDGNHAGTLNLNETQRFSTLIVNASAGTHQYRLSGTSAIRAGGQIHDVTVQGAGTVRVSNDSTLVVSGTYSDSAGNPLPVATLELVQ